MKPPDSATAQQSPPTGVLSPCLAVFCLLAVALRIFGIDRQSLWSDELFTVALAYQDDVRAILPELMKDSHPPGYALFMYFSLKMVGFSDFAVRFHSLVFGVLWVPLVFYLGQRWFSARTGLVAAALVAVSHSAIYFSQEARVYAMLVAFCLLHMALFLEYLLGKGLGARGKLFYVLIGATILYLHYAGFVFIAAEACLALLLWPALQEKRRLPVMLLMFFITLLCFLPWMEITYKQLTDPRDIWAVSSKPDWQAVQDNFHRMFGPDDAHMYFYRGLLAGVLLLWLGQFVWGWVSWPQWIVLSCCLFLALLPALAFYVKSIVSTPIFTHRYFLVTLPLLVLPVAFLLDRLLLWGVAKRAARLFLQGFLLVYVLWTLQANTRVGLYSRLDKDPVRMAVATLARDVEKHGVSHYGVLMTHYWFEHYMQRKQIPFDKTWSKRYLYTLQQIDGVDSYMRGRGNNEFYYLGLREPSAVPIQQALKARYQLRCHTAHSIKAGSIDVMRFDINAPALPAGEAVPRCG